MIGVKWLLSGSGLLRAHEFIIPLVSTSRCQEQQQQQGRQEPISSSASPAESLSYTQWRRLERRVALAANYYSSL